MKYIRYSTLFAFFAILSLSLKAQPPALSQDVKKVFYYSFENVSSESQIDNLKQNVSFLSGVTEVKSEYKPEKGTGQIIVVVIEKTVTKEGDVLFDVRSLKNAIIQSQLKPLELTQEETILKN